MKTLLTRLWHEDGGQGLAEYVLIIALLSVALMSLMVIFRNSMGKIFETVADTLENAQSVDHPTFRSVVSADASR